VTLTPNPARYGPVVDGWVLEGSPLDVIAAGDHNAVPFAVGSNAAELADAISVEVTSDEEYQEVIQTSFEVLGATWVDAILATYPSAGYPTPQDALVAVFTDARFTCPARAIARAAATGQSEPVYRYWFQRYAVTAQGPKPPIHGIELLYVFGTFNDIPGFNAAAADVALSDSMQRYWTRFARSGDPSGGVDPEWPAYTSAADDHLVLDSPITSDTELRTIECDLWDEIASQ
jgi:para-nitrobenzyl esterase